jgi:predicted acyl esterase
LFSTPPLAASETIGGAGTVRLTATLTDPTGAAAADPALVDTNFVFRLSDVDAAGAKTLITRGYLKASHRWTHEFQSAIPLGKPVDYRVPLWHVHYRVAAGHHLELTLGSGDKDCCFTAAPAAAQPLLPLTVTVAGGSALDLPVTRG